MLRKLGVAAVATVVMATAGGGQALASTSGVVISQIYGGGGNAGAPYTHDYVELFNAGSSTVELDGWSVQYASATGTGSLGANSGQLTELSGTIAPGRRLLVRESGGTTGSPLPPPDVIDATPINMAAASGKVALVTGTTGLGCNGGSSPCGPAQLARVTDLVGYGAAGFFEGSGAAPTLGNATAAVRERGGCADTDDNRADFAAADPDPRSAAAPATRCDGVALVSTTPADGAAGVAHDTDLIVRFSEPVTLADGWATLACEDSGPHGFTVSGGPEERTLDPATDFGPGEACTLTVDGASVRAAADPADTLGATRTVRFTTQPGLTRIRDVQGAGHLSPLTGQSVRSGGVVTARRATGFWMQDPQADDDPATSEGIFVFTRSAPTVAVGDSVEVTATVEEFRPGSTGLTITELTRPAVTVTGSGDALPVPQLIGPGGRQPSSTIIEDDATDVETGGIFDAHEDGIDFYESLEGMRVAVRDAVAVGPTRDFGSNREIAVLPAGGDGASVRTPRGGIVVRPNDFNPERVVLNDASSSGVRLPSVDVGDAFPGATVGVMDYSFSNFKLQATELPAHRGGGLQPEATRDAGVGELAFATFNVENLDARDSQAKFDRLGRLVVDHLRAPDLISVEEVQDDNGPVNDGTVTAGQTYARLIGAIRDAGGPRYEFRQIDPVDGRDGGEPGGNIRVGFLFREDRGLRFVDRPGGDATTPVAVAPGPALSASPGRIQPGDAAFANSRKPLAGEFEYGGRKLFVVANHWNSKGGDEPLYGPRQPPRQGSVDQRRAQARLVHEFVAQLLAEDGGARVVVMGDLNDFWFSGSLETLAGDPPVLEDLIRRLPEGERYTYVFDGNSQDLDHIAMSRAAAREVRLVDAVHVNAEFADQASDHDPVVAISCADAAAPSLHAALSHTRLWPPNHKYVRVTATASATDAIDPAPALELVSVTSSEPDDAPGDADGATTGDVRIVDDTRFDLRAERDETGPGRVYTVTYRATDACGNATERSASVSVREP